MGQRAADPALERLAGLDAWLLEAEDEVTHLNLGSAAIFEGPPPPFGEVTEMIAGKLPIVPRYRQRVRMVPGGLSRPVWAPDPHFNLEYHVRHTGLPRPGNRDQLRNLIGRVMAHRLDRSKPLWEMWVVEGLEGERWALLEKSHYALVDAVTGTDLLAVLLDESPEPSAPVPDTWRPAEQPSDLRLLVEAVADAVASPHEHARALRAARRAPRAALASARRIAGAFASRPAPPGLTPVSSLLGPIGPHRRYSWARASLGDVAVVRDAFAGANGPVPGLHVNDVVLAAVTRGYRDLLATRGEPPEHRIVRTLVPLSVYPGQPGGAFTTRVAVAVAELPVGFADPVRRLTAVHDEMARHASGRTIGAGTLTSLSGFSSPLLLALGVRVATRTARMRGPGHAQLITTNAPGPREPLYALGRRLVEVYPYTSIAAPARVGVAVYSYRRSLTFGVTTDWDSVREVDVMAAGIEEGLTELVEAARSAAHA